MGLHALFLLQVTLLEELVGQGLQEAAALHRVDVRALLFGLGNDLVGDILHAEHEGEGEALGGGEFFREAAGKIAVLHVVVADAAHFMDIAEAAVVVGQHETVGADNLARAAAAENADALAQARGRFAVERLGRELEAGLAERVRQVLLLHQLQEPHALVGTGPY